MHHRMKEKENRQQTMRRILECVAWSHAPPDVFESIQDLKETLAHWSKSRNDTAAENNSGPLAAPFDTQGAFYLPSIAVRSPASSTPSSFDPIVLAVKIFLPLTSLVSLRFASR